MSMRPTTRRSLEAAQRACADWEPRLDGQTDLLEAVAESEGTSLEDSEVSFSDQ